MELFQNRFETEDHQSQSLNQPPIIPRLKPAPLYQLCQNALSLFDAGYIEDAAKFVSFLLPLEAFPTMWCKENEYDEKITLDLFSKIKKIHYIESDFSDIYTISETGCFTMKGNGTSLGFMRFKNVEIRAFGPQITPLDFGITNDGSDGWVRTNALPFVWMYWKEAKDGGFDCKFVGLVDSPITMAFYVKANTCKVNGQIIHPKTLQRYQGDTQTVTFDDQVAIEMGLLQRIEVIPLAGEGCFWDTNFLLKCEIHPSTTSQKFFFKCL